MSLSGSDDLLCEEDSSIFSSGGDDLTEYSSDDLESHPPDFEESIAGLFEDERDLAAIISRSSHVSIDESARAQSVAWILKIQAFFSIVRRVNFENTAAQFSFIMTGCASMGRRRVQRHYCFEPLTAYLSVNYLDRFLYSHPLPEINGWPLQLLSVACLSLAAKMEEPLVPSLLNLQVEGAKFIFEPKNIQRMELLVLRVLDWRLGSVVPFCYLRFFALKVDPTGTYTGFLTSRANDIILSTIQETCSFLEYMPSCIAAATILCATNDLPNFSFITAQHAESWGDGLNKDRITSCYQLIRQIVLENRPKREIKVLAQLGVMTRASTTSSDTSSSSSSNSSSMASYKRRKLSNYSWAEDDKSS